MEGWVSRCKILYMEWISNRVLLNSTENYIQYPITGMEKNVKKKECMQVKWNHLAIKKKKKETSLSITDNPKPSSHPLSGHHC